MYVHSWDTLRNHFDIDFGIKNEGQDCKIGTVCVAGGAVVRGEG
jgi:hypothetical protein